jgi:DNA-binding CsgD family transcriptional regulator
MLEPFGVGPAAEAIYLAMLERPGRCTGGLAGDLGWTADEVESALDELARLSLLRSSPGHPDAVRPVSPAYALDALLARKNADLLRQQHEIEQGRVALMTILAELDGATAAAASGLEEYAGPDGTRQALERLAFEATREVLALTPPRGHGAASLAALDDPLNAYLLSKGVRVQMVCVNSARADVTLSASARELTGRGALLRTVPVLPLAMVVVDRTWVALPLDPGADKLGAVLLRGAGVLDVVCALFHQYWQAAIPWSHRRAPAQVLAEQERALLDMLTHGCTDEQAGRRLGVSTRTVGRMVADLMRRLGARSRFEAGVLAARQGLLAPDAGDAEPMSS